MTFFSFVRPYRGQIVLTFIFILIANILSLALPWGIKLLIDDVLVQRNVNSLHFLMIGLAAILILRSVFSFLRKFISYRAGEHILCRLRQEIFSAIQRMSLLRIKKLSPAQILTRITGDVDSLRRFIFGDVIEFFYSFLSLGFIVIVLFHINMRLAGAALFILPLFAMTYFRMVGPIKRGYKNLRENYGQTNARLNEFINGIATVRVFDGAGFEQKRFERQQKQILDTATKNHFLNVSLWTWIEIFTSMGLVGVLWIGGWDVLNSRMTPGELVAFYSYLGMLFTPLMRFAVFNSSYQEAEAAFGRIKEIFEVPDAAPKSGKSFALSRIKGRVEFQDVSFGYSQGEDILRNINFSVQPGEVVGVVGPSGVGKTTLIHLLTRLLECERGVITIDGHDLRELDLTFYRQNSAVALQDDFLFRGTIRENISYGRFDALLDEIQEVAKVAQAHDFIENLEYGYETQIAERGGDLSSGQRQRIAIARALLRRPSILILDEATSAVDALTENAIQEGIRDYLKGKTIFIVAHRFSTIAHVDKIIVLRHGKVADIGSHDYLLKRRGFYSSLYLEQFKSRDLSPYLSG